MRKGLFNVEHNLAALHELVMVMPSEVIDNHGGMHPGSGRLLDVPSRFSRIVMQTNFQNISWSVGFAVTYLAITIWLKQTSN